ncbi:MAG TPA: PEPxxWA-CTERM sorting domain-containing protein [Sphingomonas sp.]|nr:PEPxxWA-CTERM sorting domain-containing protein [Sphingomonas sp.]
MTKRSGILGRGFAVGCLPVIGAMALGSATPASALVIETATVQNSYAYGVSTGNTVDPNNPKIGGDTGKFFVPAHLVSEESEVGVQFEGTAGPGKLFFLHNNYCVGTCQTFSQTIITFDLFNDSNAAVDLRFDSQITPGHIARIFGSQDVNLEGQFDFSVRQFVSNEPNTLYSAQGGVNSDGIFLFQSDQRDFNGQTRQSNFNAGWDVMDWGTTNLSLQLATLGAGERTQVQYIATYGVTSNAACTSITDCGGLQIVFGDPRNDGGVSNRGTISAFGPQSDDPTPPAYPVIGRNYGTAGIFANFVPIDTPLPEDPDPFTPPTYGPLFIPTAGVPEPSAWALMVGGIGMIGGIARRRRRPSAPAIA